MPDAMLNCYIEALVKVTESSTGGFRAIYGGTRKVNPQKNFETVVNISNFKVGEEVEMLSLIKTLLKQFC